MEKGAVWITGATSGIGKALALQYAKNSSVLILTARRLDVLEEVRKECLQLGCPEVHIYELDMAQSEQIDQVYKRVKELVPKVDVLINNAGISQRSLVLDTTLDVYRQLMEVDYFGVIHLTKNILPDMIKNGGGKLVVISSLVGKFSTPLRSGYAAAKHALHGFFDALRTEVKSNNIKVTIICPGFIQTDVSVNALIGDGSAQNTMDKAQQNGMQVSVFSQKAFKAIQKNKAEVYIGGKETLGVYVNRFFPSFFRSIIIGRAKIN